MEASPKSAPTNPLYRRPVPVDREKHKNTRIAPLAVFDFAAGIQSVPVTLGEFGEAHKEYPIVFLRTPQAKVLPAALLGLRRNENLYVNASGAWEARYVPAFVRRYPFIFADAGNDRLTLCFDELYVGVDADTGERLFVGGVETPYLKRMLEFMSACQSDFRATEQFCKHIDELEVLTQMSAAAEMKSGEKYVIENFLVVDEAKLRGIDSVSVGRMFQSGELAFVYAHLMSLSNLGKLIDLLAART